MAWSALITGGIYYLCLYKDRSEFCGLDINNPDHIRRLNKTIHDIALFLDSKKKQTNHLRAIADKLRAKGVSEDVIRECLG